MASSSSNAQNEAPTAGRVQEVKTVRVAKWYFGGVAGSMAACVTHPLDLLKVILQTEGKVLQTKTPVSIKASTMNVIRTSGIRGLYNGLSASILRQLTYSTTRFGIYEIARAKVVKPGESMAFLEKVGLAAVSGAAGGFIGTPADMINVRMQNDMKLPLAERRNYKNAFDGLYQVFRKEGITNLFNGASMAISRAVFVTIGQISFYEQVKQMLLASPFFNDNLVTHLSSSFAAGAIATTLTQPLDVLKTRIMNATSGQYTSVIDCVIQTAREGPHAFYKGYIPAFVRLGPHTILMWIFLEQMRLNFGIIKKVE
ncbi:mitochondrial dicarboxylate carrier-like [Varroa jacobsoni]|uniref:Mitochondrial dicarboxylate carrier n=1 Tax=Varroa destructor TaxID=109461 RepID=A0A7M7MD90_VARDE|nr:mitochondrial dicarboxylate carrier-like [Varroa destructor]XP_022711512.1 mitochondrial dicarboxylate carrier-like [Varroa jacobsoni]